MIPFFTGYAVLVWFAAARFRRQWKAFAWVGAGIVGLIIVALLHIQLNVWTHGQIYLPVLQSILYPYTVVVAVMGLYLACLPRRVPEAHCTRCRYDLRGLEREPELCPECGASSTRARPARSRPAGAPHPGVLPGPATSGPIVCLDPGDQ
ncbi:MAG: hypothetical protein IT437_00205 [Phycisphaerales bacterium]|nr:hypothetical protein [Phycisphaerales bacterium]